MISIIVPVYNVEKYLRDCLDSIAAQTCRDFEAILIDDGSTDSSGDVCDEYAKTDKRFRVIHQQNAGVSVARNNGLEKARGEYVAFVDADDVIVPNFVEVLLEKGKNSDVCFFSIEMFDLLKGEQKVMAVPDFYSHDRNTIEEVLLERVKPTVFGYTWTKIIRRSLVTENGVAFVPQLNYKEDELFISQGMRYAKSVCCVSDILYKYRICNDASSLSSQGYKQPASVLYRYVIQALKNVEIYTLPALVAYEYWRLADILHQALYRRGTQYDYARIVAKLHDILGISPAAYEILPQKLGMLLRLPKAVSIPAVMIYITASKIQLKLHYESK